MSNPLDDPGVRERVRQFCQDELFDHYVYKELARVEKDESRRRVLEEMAEHEWSHYEFWKSIGGECREGVNPGKAKLYVLMRRLLGLTFTMKYLERHELDVINQYREYLDRLEGEERERLEKILEDEMKHERTHMESIDEKIVKYIGFIVLGMADAIIEITGVHAGFLGVTSSTIMAGIAGLIVGLSAAISMASAAYLQAKHDVERSPLTSALLTGVAYIFAVILLALPYFVTHAMSIAFTVSVVLAVLMIAGFTYYGAVLQEKPFMREFLESTGLMLGTAFGAFLFGEALGRIFGIQEIFASAP